MWTPRRLKDVPAGAKFIPCTWSIKKKTNGTYRDRLNTRGFQQVERVHYDAADIASTVTNNMSIRIVMVLTLTAGWIAEVVDVKGAFLHGEFVEVTELVYMAVSKGF